MKGNLQKYMLKSGKDKADMDVYKKAGQKHESEKLKSMSSKNDTKVGGDVPVKPPTKGSKSGEMSEVDCDEGEAGSTPEKAEFGPVSRKKKKPEYLD